MALSLADGILTRMLVRSGVAVEANPVMRLALDRSPAVFLVVKMLLVAGGVLLLWRERRRAVAFLSLQACLAMYAAVVAYQLVIAASLFLSRGPAFP